MDLLSLRCIGTEVFQDILKWPAFHGHQTFDLSAENNGLIAAIKFDSRFWYKKFSCCEIWAACHFHYIMSHLTMTYCHVTQCRSQFRQLQFITKQGSLSYQKISRGSEGIPSLRSFTALIAPAYPCCLPHSVFTESDFHLISSFLYLFWLWWS